MLRSPPVGAAELAPTHISLGPGVAALLRSPPPENVNASGYQTGMWSGAELSLAAYAHEYWRE